jgi:flagellar biosynthesis GTPase FlhF
MAITVQDVEYRHFVEGLVGRIMALGPNVALSTTDTYRPGASLDSAYGHATLVPVIVAGTPDHAADHLTASLYDPVR